MLVQDLIMMSAMFSMDISKSLNEGSNFISFSPKINRITKPLQLENFQILILNGKWKIQFQVEATWMFVTANRRPRRHIQRFVVSKRIKTQRLQIGCHQAGSTVEKGFLSQWFGTRWYEFLLVALIEYVLHFNKPSKIGKNI